MPAFDINAIINAAIAEAVNARLTEVLQQHANIVGALAERIDALENQAIVTSNAVDARIAVLENNPAQGVDSTLERIDTLEKNEEYLVKRIAALETNTTVLDQHGGLLEALDNQEWFWEKLTRKAREVAEAVAEQAVEQHCEEYDHDNYDEAVRKIEDMPDFDDLVTKDYLSESVRDAVQDLSFEVRVS